MKEINTLSQNISLKRILLIKKNNFIASANDVVYSNVLL